MVYSIRLVSQNDANILANLITQLGYPLPPQEMEQRITTYLKLENYYIYAAICEDKIVGVVAFAVIELFHRPGKLARITALVVDQHYRQQGVGKVLINYIEKKALHLGCENVELTSGAHRAPSGAHKFYKSLGYADIEHNKIYFRKKIS
jgi:GNAT superfamily N-acetyltransferase